MIWAPHFSASSRILSAGTITPRSTTSKLLHRSTTATMFLPMSWTSPFTVAISTVPRVDLASSSEATSPLSAARRASSSFSASM